MKKSLTLLSLLFGTTALSGGVMAAENKMQHNKAGAHQTMTKMDDDMAVVIKTLEGMGGKPIETLTAPEARQQPSPADAVMTVMKQQNMDPKAADSVVTNDIMIPGVGVNIPARIYKPEGTKNNAALPVVVYYHGGGWVIADLDTYDATPRAIAKQANVMVVSAHYRQAPEHKFPAAHTDAFTAYQWALKNAAGIGGDPKRVAVMGESAGANLAINVAIMARDQKVPTPLHQVLVYPVAGVDMTTESYQEHANAKPLNKPMMAWFMSHVLRSEKDKQDPRLDIVGKADLAGLPPTTLITAEIDPLRSEAEALGAKLHAAGVPVNSKNYDGVTHEFFGMGAVVSDAKAAQAEVVRDLASSFNQLSTANR